jgi:hypothetical protein
MADEKPASNATVERSERTESAVESTSVNSDVVTDSQQGVSGAAQNDTQSFSQFHNNLAALNPQVQGENVWVNPNTPEIYQVKGDGVTLSQPPTDGGPAVQQSGQGETALNDAGGFRVMPNHGIENHNQAATDGKITVPSERPANMSPEQYEKLKQEAAALEQHLANPENKLTEQQRQDIERSAEQLINNKNADGSDRKPPLDPAQVAEVLKQTNRMFTDVKIDEQNGGRSDTAGFTSSDRNTAATAMIHDIANPTHANQGLNNTCNVTAAMKAEMLTNPGAQTQRYVDMFANNNVDQTGMRYTMVGDQKVYYDKGSIIPDNEAHYAANGKQGSGARDAYVQGMNHLYVNAVTQERGEFYSEVRTTREGDTGERREVGRFGSGLYATKPDGTIDASPAMGAQDVQNIMNKIGAGSLAADSSRFGPGANLNVTGGDPASLDRAWQANGGKPMVIAVDTGAAMFNSATGVGGKGGGHVVTLVDQRVNPQTGQTEYLMQNSWGEKLNGWVTAEAISSAMNPRNGDRSGNPTPQGGDGAQPRNDGGGSSANWSEQNYVRPGGGGAQGGDAASGGSSDGSNYGQNNNPRRNSGGILMDEAAKAERDYQERLKQDEEAQKLIKEAKQRQLEEEEAARLRERMRKLRTPGGGG